MNKILVVLCVLIAMSVAALPTLADGPEQGSADYYHEEFLDCAPYGFDYITHVLMEGRINWKVFYDNQDNPIRYQENANLHGTATNLTTGTTMRQVASVGSKQLDLVTGTWDDHGHYHQWHLPGYGSVYIQSGRIVWDSDGNIVVQVGRADEPTVEQICEILSQ